MTAVERRSIPVALEPVAMIPAMNGPFKYEASLVAVVIANVPWYAKDGMPVVAKVEAAVCVPAAVTAAMDAVAKLSASDAPAVFAFPRTALDPDVVKNEPARSPLVDMKLLAPVPPV